MAELGQPSGGETRARVAVCGASGFAGALGARLVWDHPSLELVAATAREDAGRAVAELYPRHPVPLVMRALEPDAIADAADAAIVAYPHGAAASTVAALRERGLAVIDLSADFRFEEAASYEAAYGPHAAPELIGEAVYGLTELERERIAGAELVANPGCYPTATLLALAPLASAGLIVDVVVDAKSGVSGAGRGGGDRLHFATVAENVVAYGTEGHRHEPEIATRLAELAAGIAPRLTFVPHLMPLDQGELVSCYVALDADASETEIGELYAERYADEPFVEMVDAPPGVRDVRETNRCLIHVAPRAASGRLVVLAVIDNLWKGAAGQAIQNLNLMLGLEETEGLR